MSEPTTLQQICGYDLRERLGKGGCGVVYKAYQPMLDREVAVKVILPDLANNPDFVSNLESEAKIIAKLEHPYIVPLFEYCRDGDGYALVMRCLNGGSLRQAIKKHGMMAMDAVGRVVEQVGGALASAHRFGIIHRDLKPENILLDESGNAYLSDFGIAMEQDHDTDNLPFSGTVEYASLEQLQGFPPVPTMDIYSFGFIMYEMLTGSHPFAGLPLHEIIYKHTYEALPLIEEISNIDVFKLNEVLQRATAKNPVDRYQDITALIADFQKARRLEPTEIAEAVLAGEDAHDSERIAQEHIDYLYKRLGELYEKLQVDGGDDGDGDAPQFATTHKNPRLQRLEQQLEYRSASLKNIQTNARFSPPLSLTPPAEPQHSLVGVDALRESLKAKLIGGKSATLIGPSGVGKSELVASLARDEAVQEHFNGYVMWFPVGKKPDLFTLMGDWLRALDVPEDELSRITTLEERHKRLHSVMSGKPALVVCDDVWKAEHVKNSVFDNRSKFVYLLTTQLAGVAADFLWDALPVEGLNVEQRLKLLSQLVANTDEDDEKIRRVVERLGGFPRDVVLLGTRLRKAVGNASRLQREIDKVLKQPSEVFAQGYASIQMTIEELSDEAKRAFWSIAQLPPEPNTISEWAGESICEDLSLLDELVDYSLLMLSNDRYRMHPSFAEYARAQLPADETVYARIVQTYFDYVDEHYTSNKEIALEQQNITAALDMAKAHALTDAFAVTVTRLAKFWEANGMIEAAESYLGMALELAQADERAALHLALAKLEMVRGGLEASEQHINDGLAAVSALPTDDKKLRMALVWQKGAINHLRNHFDEAKAFWQETLLLAQTLDDQEMIASAHNSLGTLEVNSGEDGGLDAAKSHYLSALVAARRSKSSQKVADVLTNLGLLEAQMFRNYDQAKKYLVEGVTIARELGHAELLSALLQSRGSLELAQGNDLQAELYYKEALQKAQISHNVEAIGWAAVSLANTMITLGLFDKAQTHLDESLKMAQLVGNTLLLQNVVSVLLRLGEMRILFQKPQYDKDLWQRVQDAAESEGLDAEQVAWLRDTRVRMESLAQTDPRRAKAIARYKIGQVEGNAFYDFVAAATYYGESLKLARELNAPELVLQAAVALSDAQLKLGDLQKAETALENLTEQPEFAPVVEALIAVGEARLAADNRTLNDALWTAVLERANGLPTYERLAALYTQLKTPVST